MEEGAPVAYSVLEKGVPVLASDGTQVGTVDHVVAAYEQDIFHGLVISAHGGRRFVPAEDVQSLHEHGVDLRLDTAAVAALSPPGGGAPSFHEDPGEIMGWHHWARKLSLRKDWDRDR
jgi:sporulation protein YlmC with PRC-barrel domain